MTQVEFSILLLFIGSFSLYLLFRWAPRSRESSAREVGRLLGLKEAFSDLTHAELVRLCNHLSASDAILAMALW